MKHKFLTLLLVMVLGAVSSMGQGNTLHITNIAVSPGDTAPLRVEMNNSDDIVAVQFDLIVPRGFELDEYEAVGSSRTRGFYVTMTLISPGLYRTLVFSENNSVVTGNSGEILRVPMKVREDVSMDEVHEIDFKDVVIAIRGGENVADGEGCTAGEIHTGFVDLKVTDFLANNGNRELVPGSIMDIEWKVYNVGNLPLSSGWTEKLYLQWDGSSEQNAAGTTANGTEENETGLHQLDLTSSVLLFEINHQDAFAPQDSLVNSGQFVIPQVLGRSGTARLILTVEPDLADEECDWLKDNNIQTFDDCLVTKIVILSIEGVSDPRDSQMDEASEETFTVRVSRSGETDKDEVFEIKAIEDERVIVPKTMTIPKGEVTAEFPVQLRANGRFDQNKDIIITVMGDGYNEDFRASCRLTIVDDTLPSLRLSLDKDNDRIVEGDVFELIIEAEEAPEKSLWISLSSDQPSRVEIEEKTLLSKHEKLTTSTVYTVDDSEPTMRTMVTITAKADGYQDAQITFALTDNDPSTQQIKLKQGWNWISTYLDEPIALDELPACVDKVWQQPSDPNKSDHDLVEDYMMPGKSYKIHSNEDVTLELKGLIFNPWAEPIVVEKGLNWIGFPHHESIAIEDAILNPSDRDCVLSQYGFCEYTDGQWEGSITHLRPGEGYIYKSNSEECVNLEFDFTNPSKAPYTSDVVGSDLFGELDIHQYPSTTNLTAVLSSNYDDSFVSGDVKVYAFTTKDEFRGVSKLIGSYYYITIYGKDLETYFFRLEVRNNDNLIRIDRNQSFTEKSGDRKSPKIITSEELAGIEDVLLDSNANLPLNIYSIQGILLKSNATDQDIRELLPGLYVINNKKYLVK